MTNYIKMKLLIMNQHPFWKTGNGKTESPRPFIFAYIDLKSSMEVGGKYWAAYKSRD